MRPPARSEAHSRLLSRYKKRSQKNEAKKIKKSKKTRFLTLLTKLIETRISTPGTKTPKGRKDMAHSKYDKGGERKKIGDCGLAFSAVTRKGTHFDDEKTNEMQAMVVSLAESICENVHKSDVAPLLKTLLYLIEEIDRARQYDVSIGGPKFPLPAPPEPWECSDREWEMKPVTEQDKYRMQRHTFTERQRVFAATGK